VNALKHENQAGLIFTNLNDLDMIYGHRRNVEGYGRQIEMIDTELPKILAALSPNDLLILTADHGNDPTYRGTDHTREHVPLLVYSHSFTKASRELRRLQDRNSFSDIGQTIIENFGIAKKTPGTSFLALVA
jgi:phosphopentomutase